MFGSGTYNYDRFARDLLLKDAVKFSGPDPGDVAPDFTLRTIDGDKLRFYGDSGGENFTVHIDATGAVQVDDTLKGTLKARFTDFNDAHQVVRTRNQEIPWTAVRGLHGSSTSLAKD